MVTLNAQEEKCFALCQNGSKDETLISCSEAKVSHGVCIRHGQMLTNGELRFRLNASDGSAYIRTQTTEQSEGWQSPHFHKLLKETHIVEKGWIGYAELKDGSPIVKRFGPGDVFTTRPHVVHNIFMATDSVIHTVKHGGQPQPLMTIKKADWWSNKDSNILKRLVGKSFPSKISLSSSLILDNTPINEDKKYNAAYRHFDTLIWQVPAWSTGLFAVIVASVNSFLISFHSSLQGSATTQQSINLITVALHLPIELFAAIQISFFGFFTFALAYALYRFRWHQVGTKAWNRTSESPFFSPQTFLQGLVNIEAALLLLVAGTLADLPTSAVVVALILIFGYFTFSWERNLNLKKICSVRSSSQVLRQKGAAIFQALARTKLRFNTIYLTLLMRRQQYDKKTVLNGSKWNQNIGSPLYFFSFALFNSNYERQISVFQLPLAEKFECLFMAHSRQP